MSRIKKFVHLQSEDPDAELQHIFSISGHSTNFTRTGLYIKETSIVLTDKNNICLLGKPLMVEGIHEVKSYLDKPWSLLNLDLSKLGDYTMEVHDNILLKFKGGKLEKFDYRILDHLFGEWCKACIDPILTEPAFPTDLETGDAGLSKLEWAMLTLGSDSTLSPFGLKDRAIAILKTANGIPLD